MKTIKVVAPLLLSLVSGGVMASSFASPFDSSAIEKEREIIYREVPVLTDPASSERDFEIRHQPSIPSGASAEEIRSIVGEMINNALERERESQREREEQAIADRLEQIITEDSPEFRTRIVINGKRLMFDEEAGQFMVFEGEK